MKTIKFNGYLLPNVGACVKDAPFDAKCEFLRLIKKAYGGDYSFCGKADNYGIPIENLDQHTSYFKQYYAERHYTLLPISLATTWLKVALGEITRENWVVDVEAEKDHLKFEEFKKAYCKTTGTEWSFSIKYYGFMDGHDVNFSNKELFESRRNLPIITIEMALTYFYEQEEKPKYVTGQRFKGVIKDQEVEYRCEGVIVIGNNGKFYALQNKCNGSNNHFISDMMGYKYAWWIGDSMNEVDRLGIIKDLELLPDPAEPVKGDEIEVSDNGVKWSTNVNKNYTRIYTGYQKKNGYYVYDYDGEIFSCKHIRLAPSPEKLAREQAEKKADEFMKENYPMTEKINPNHFYQMKNAVTEYILKEKM